MKRLQLLLETALKDMPRLFSSNEFAVRLRELNFSEREIATLQARFLHSRCQQMDTKRTWSKIEGIEAKRTSKVKQTIESNSIESIGIIRRFLKWIY